MEEGVEDQEDPPAVSDAVGDTKSSSRGHCRHSGRSNSKISGQVGAPDSSPRVTYHHESFTTSSTSQSSGGRTDPHPGRLEEPTYADPCCDTKEPFCTKNGPPPYSHVENSTRAELDQLGLTALRAMVDVQPYGSCDLGGYASDDEPPSMTSASPSEDDDPEDPENPSGKKKKKKRTTKRQERRRSQEAKAIATCKIVVNLPEFTGKDLSEFAENFGRFLRMTGQTRVAKWASEVRFEV